MTKILSDIKSFLLRKIYWYNVKKSYKLSWPCYSFLTVPLTSEPLPFRKISDLPKHKKFKYYRQKNTIPDAICFYTKGKQSAEIEQMKQTVSKSMNFAKIIREINWTQNFLCTQVSLAFINNEVNNNFPLQLFITPPSHVPKFGCSYKKCYFQFYN
jgi:hypothetical protein